MSNEKIWLLDEQLPNSLRKIFEKLRIEAHTVKYAGFTGLKNGVLRNTLYAAGYRWFLTQDFRFEEDAHFPLKRHPDLTIVYLTVAKERADFMAAIEKALGQAPLLAKSGRSYRWP